LPVYWASSAGIITSAGAGIVSELAVCKLAMTWLGADPAALSNVTTITSISTKEEVLCNVVYNTARIAVLEDHSWQFALRESQLNLAAGTAEALASAVVITGITAADPCVVTAVSHGFENGWLVRISNVSGMEQINGMVIRVTNKDANTFECYQLDGRKFDAYTSGGQVIRYEVIPDYANGYVYEVPDDMIRPISLVPAGPQWEVVGSGYSRRLLTPVSAAVLQYVADVSVVADMPNHFARAWAARIAMELANPLQKANAAMKDMAAWYAQVLGENKSSDGSNVDPAHIVRNTSPTLRDGGWE
jgi:hypothetical protein